MVDLSEFEQFEVDLSEFDEFEVDAAPDVPRQPTKGFRGIGQDVLQSVANIPKEVLEGFRSMVDVPEQAAGAANQWVNQPDRFAKNELMAAGSLGENLAKFPSTIQNYLKGKEIIPEGQNLIPPPLRVGDLLGSDKVDWNQVLNMGERQPGDELIQGLIKYAPFGKAASMGSKVGALKNAGKQALGAGAFEAVEGRSPITGAGASLGMDAPFYGIGRAAVPFKGRLDAPELVDNIRAFEGTDVPLGPIIESPTLDKFQTNVLDKAFFSGAEGRGKKITDQINERGLGLLDGQLAEAPNTPMNARFKNILDATYENQKRLKNKLYEPANELAAQEGFYPELKESQKYAAKVVDQIKDSPILGKDLKLRDTLRKANIIKSPTETRVNKSQILDAQGNPITDTTTIRPSVVEIRTAAGELFKEGEKLENSPGAIDRHQGGILKELANRMRDDVNSEIAARGSQELKEAYAKADANFKENFAPFLDEDINKYKADNYTADSIAREIIQPGKEDKYTKIQKIQRVMPEEHKNALGLAYLSGAFDNKGKLNPKELSQRIKKLGKNQMEALFPDPEIRKTLRDFEKLREGSEEALSAMVNPKTGARLGEFIKLLQSIGAYGASSNPIAAAGLIAGPGAASSLLNAGPYKSIYLNRLLNEKRGRPTITGTAGDLIRTQAFAQRGDNE